MPTSTVPDTNQIRLDAAWLADLGLASLPAWKANEFLQAVYDTLELRVGMRLADEMTSAQLEEFEALMREQDREGAVRWLGKTFPSYRTVVMREHAYIAEEIRSGAKRILADFDPENGDRGAQGVTA